MQTRKAKCWHLFQNRPAEAVRLKIVNAMKATGKPTVALFLGYTPAVARDENVWFASSLDEAARPGLPAFTRYGAT